jgi:c-di-GMP-binding flagellar brake protein YcgR
MLDTKNFNPLTTIEARSQLQLAASQQARVMIWTEGQKISFNSRMQKFTEAAQTFLISASGEGGGLEFERTLRTYGIVECLFSLHLPTDILFFKGELKRSDHQYLNFKVEQPVYKLQRRLSLRLPVSPGKASKVKIHLSADDQQPIEVDLLNISEGGIAVLFGQEPIFKVLTGGKKLAKISFELSGITVMGSGEVRHTTELVGSRKDSRYRVGIHFTQIDAKLKDQLIRFVLEESSRYFGRKM